MASKSSLTMFKTLDFTEQLKTYEKLHQIIIKSQKQEVREMAQELKDIAHSDWFLLINQYGEIHITYNRGKSTTYPKADIGTWSFYLGYVEMQDQRSPGGRSPGEHSPGERSPGGRSPGERSPGEHSPGGRSPGERSSGERRYEKRMYFFVNYLKHDETITFEEFQRKDIYSEYTQHTTYNIKLELAKKILAAAPKDAMDILKDVYSKMYIPSTPKEAMNLKVANKNE